MNKSLEEKSTDVWEGVFRVCEVISNDNLKRGQIQRTKFNVHGEFLDAVNIRVYSGYEIKLDLVEKLIEAAKKHNGYVTFLTTGEINVAVSPRRES